MIRFLKTVINKKNKYKNLGSILHLAGFGNTALPAAYIFPFGFCSKTPKDKMVMSVKGELMGQNYILGSACACEELEDGEMMIYSTNSEKERRATIKLNSKDDEGTIEITAANGDKKTAKMTLNADGEVELYSTDEEGKEKSKITLDNKGNLEMNAKSGDRTTSKMTLQADGKIELQSTDNEGSEKAKIILDKNGKVEILTNENKTKITLNQNGTIEIAGNSIVVNAKNANINCEEKATISAKSVEISGRTTVEI